VIYSVRDSKVTHGIVKFLLDAHFRISAKIFLVLSPDLFYKYYEFGHTNSFHIRIFT